MRLLRSPQSDNYLYAIKPVLSGNFSHHGSQSGKSFLLPFIGSRVTDSYPSFQEWNVLLKDQHISDTNLSRKEVSHAEFQHYLRIKNQKTGTMVRNHSVWVWVAAISLIFIFVLTSFLNYLKIQNCSNLFSQNYRTPIFNELSNCNVKIQDLNLSISEYYYNRRNFTTAGKYLDIISVNSSFYYKAQLLSAICLMENNKFREALEKLKTSSMDPAIFTYYEWYSGLCYLKLGRINNARVSFNSIPSSQQFLKKNAAKILKELNSLH